MRLADLHPVVTAAGKGDLNELTFDCPRCGPPYRICVYMRLHGPAGNGVWAWEMGPPGQLEGVRVPLHDYERRRYPTLRGDQAVTPAHADGE
jgi:hypothetical protein